MQEALTGGWLSLDEAAQILHVAPDTVRRRVKRGQLKGRQASTPYGFRWEVLLEADVERVDAVATAESSPIQVVDTDRDPLFRELLQQNAQLTSQLLEKAEAAAMWQGRAEVLSEELGKAQNRILLLEAPKNIETSRSWWQFWKRD